MNPKEAGEGGMDCIDISWDRDKWRAVVITEMSLRVP
jgi:hypothetical protein